MQVGKADKKIVNVKSLKDWQEFILKGTATMNQKLLKKMTRNQLYPC